MRSTIFAIVFALTATVSDAQGTFQFHATLTGANQLPPNSSATVAEALFTLNGATLGGDFWLLFQREYFAPLASSLEGPSMGTTRGTRIYEFFGPVTFMPYEGTGGGDNFWGAVELSPNQVAQLWYGQLYVNMTSAIYPEGHIRGPLLPIPEPSVWCLLLCGGAALIRSEPRHTRPPQASTRTVA